MTTATVVAAIKGLGDNVVKLQHYGPLRNILAGAGIAYAIEKEKYWQLPITFVVPSIYAGYHGYKNRREAVKFFVGDAV